jgi:hypothetical protein
VLEAEDVSKQLESLIHGEGLRLHSKKQVNAQSRFDDCCARGTWEAVVLPLNYARRTLVFALC